MVDPNLIQTGDPGHDVNDPQNPPRNRINFEGFQFTPTAPPLNAGGQPSPALPAPEFPWSFFANPPTANPTVAESHSNISTLHHSATSRPFSHGSFFAPSPASTSMPGFSNNPSPVNAGAAPIFLPESENFGALARANVDKRIVELESIEIAQKEKIQNLENDSEIKKGTIDGLLKINSRLQEKLQEIMESYDKATKALTELKLETVTPRPSRPSRNLQPPSKVEPLAESPVVSNLETPILAATSNSNEEVKELQRKLVESESRLKALKLQNESTQQMMNDLRSNASSNLEKLNHQFDLNDRLKEDLQAHESKLKEYEDYFEELQLSITALREQLEVARNLKIEEFREAYHQGLLNIDDFSENMEDEEYEEDEGDQDPKGKGKGVSQNKEGNMYSVLLDATSDVSDISDSDNDEGSASNGDSTKMKKLIEEMKEEANTLKARLEREQKDNKKKIRELEDKQKELEMALKNLMEANASVTTENHAVLETLKKNLKKCNDDYETAMNHNDTLSEIVQLMEKSVMQPVENFSKSLNEINFGNKLNPISEGSTNKGSYATRIEFIEEILKKIKMIIDFVKTTTVNGSKDNNSNLGELLRDNNEKVESVLYNNIKYLRTTFHELKRALHKATNARPLTRSRHLRSKLREKRTAIIHIRGASGISGDAEHLAHLRKMFESLVDDDEEIKSVKVISQAKHVVLLRLNTLTFPELLFKAKDHSKILNSIMVLHLPHWKQLIVHNVPVGRFFYSDNNTKTTTDPYKVIIRDNQSFDMLDMCMQLQLLLQSGSVRQNQNNIVGLPRFYSPYEFYGARDKVSLILCYQNDNLFENALMYGITMFDSPTVLKTEPVMGPLKNVFSQAGLFAIIDTLKE